MHGYEVPIHRSLTQVIMIAGVPREMAIINGTITSALVLGLHSILGLPLGIVLHMVASSLSKKDEQFFDTFKRQIKQKKYYHA